ncbi:hypothetical protein [Hydrogenophaga sp.]|uniref:hypothetical protein n=1 Tax=Hydrogenophaga sp. TaxID=1904254 RepID=UPI00272F930B|nr:hypothetical protein [Hydrogenophaga sp.]MDP2018038.1 hypothetical protein [Hydrogenophaga sp.]MDP3166339.1 hypothetical protein [Hydrogenophaga sp.]MDP3811329.1 hypothetical protein [Hydrogenophaga sp.]
MEIGLVLIEDFQIHATRVPTGKLPANSMLPFEPQLENKTSCKEWRRIRPIVDKPDAKALRSFASKAGAAGGARMPTHRPTMCLFLPWPFHCP